MAKKNNKKKNTKIVKVKYFTEKPAKEKMMTVDCEVIKEQAKGGMMTVDCEVIKEPKKEPMIVKAKIKQLTEKEVRNMFIVEKKINSQRKKGLK
jgi:hypothetical protein